MKSEISKKVEDIHDEYKERKGINEKIKEKKEELAKAKKDLKEQKAKEKKTDEA